MARRAVLLVSIFFLFFTPVDPWKASLEKYNAILNRIRISYPSPWDEKRVVFSSMQGFLFSLDPHSVFFDPLNLRSLFEEQNGNFYGIGIRVTSYGGRLTVVSTVKGLPAERAGVQAGDVLVEIDGQNARDMDLDGAKALLRGVRGTETEIKIQREGVLEVITFRLKRERVPLHSLGYVFVHPANLRIGYISIRIFGNQTAAELRAGLEKLRSQNISGLIFDLRNNPGGSLEAAVQVADLFLPRGATVVTVRSRRDSQVYRAVKNRQYEDLPMVCLVNRSSASSSEIVAGALQDHRRATIVGQRTWGKGLVETLSRVSFNCAVALTTATYLTPSGRALQRDFSSPWEYINFSYAGDYDTFADINGGVRPDILVKASVRSPLVLSFTYRGFFYEFSRRLLEEKRPISGDFRADEPLMAEFREFLRKKEVNLGDEEWQKNRQDLQNEIEQQVVSDRFSPEAGMAYRVRSDPVCTRALETLLSAVETPHPLSKGK